VFREAKISRDAWFENVRFKNTAWFDMTEFNRDVWFTGAHFSGDANFPEAHFNGDAGFEQTTFTHRANFEQSKFQQAANWTSCIFEGDVSFEWAVFRGVPEFNFASFMQPPYLSHIEIPSLVKGGDFVERYRKLKKMAIDSNDHENELKFFGYETHAKAFLNETPKLQKILIRLYYLFSNFGQSISRPLYSLVFFVYGMFCLNAIFITVDSRACSKNAATKTHMIASFTISSALPIIAMSDKQKEAVKECLFGESVLTLKHNVWRTAHIVPASIFLFLFVLGVRNRFKIK